MGNYGQTFIRSRGYEETRNEIRKSKAIVAAYLEDDLNAWNAKEYNDITSKTKWKLYHMGNERTEDVDYGYDNETECFLVAATDTGGLTNARMHLNDDKWSIKYAFDPLVIQRPSSHTTVAEELYRAWLKLSNKSKFWEDDETLQKFAKWVDSASTYDCKFMILQHSDEYIRLISARTILDKLGKYYTKNYSGGQFASEKNSEDLDGLHASYSEKGYVTPNINSRNIANEYIPVATPL